VARARRCRAGRRKADALRSEAPGGARYFAGAIGVRDHAGPTVFAARVVGGAVDARVTRAGYDGALARRARATLEGALTGG
jgi:hypothetical protein